MSIFNPTDSYLKYNNTKLARNSIFFKKSYVTILYYYFKSFNKPTFKNVCAIFLMYVSRLSHSQIEYFENNNN